MKTIAIWPVWGTILLFSAARAQELPVVERVDLHEACLADFTDRDLDVPAGNFASFPLPYYLAHFHRLVNPSIRNSARATCHGAKRISRSAIPWQTARGASSFPSNPKPSASV